MKSPLARSRSPSSTRSCKSGNGPITPPAPISPWVADLLRSSSPNFIPHPTPRGVTNLLDEYNALTQAKALVIVAEECCYTSWRDLLTFFVADPSDHLPLRSQVEGA